MRRIGGLASVFLSLFGAVEVRAQDAPLVVNWYVADRFRLFDEASSAARARIEVLLNEIREAGDENVDLVPFYGRLLETLAGEDAFSLRASNYAPSSPSNSIRSGRYSSDYLYPAAYTIRVSASSARAEASCRWRIGDRSSTAPCGTEAEMTVPARADGSGADAELFLAIGSGRERRAADIVIADHLVVAMGDSYISGEGNPDVPVRFEINEEMDGRRFVRSDWPARLHRGRRERLSHGEVVPEGREYRPAVWWDQPCHRSLLSWPVLASVAFAARDLHRAVTLVHLGCSGDEVTDGMLHLRRELPGGGRENQSHKTKCSSRCSTALARDGGSTRCCCPSGVMMSALATLLPAC